jgi:hypothetical protein
MAKNVLVVIHGITPEINPANQADFYGKFIDKIQAGVTSRSGHTFDRVARVFWGQTPSDSDVITREDQYLNAGEAGIGRHRNRLPAFMS